MFQRIRMQWVFKFCGISVLYINIMIIKLAEHMVDCVSFQRTELISQRKLIQGIFLKTCHKASVGYDLQGKCRTLGKLSTFAVGKIPGGQQLGCQCKTYKDETRYNHSQYAVHVRYTFYTFIFVHLSFLPETGYS